MEFAQDDIHITKLPRRLRIALGTDRHESLETDCLVAELVSASGLIVSGLSTVHLHGECVTWQFLLIVL
jgi:hypothetical protein